MQGSLCSIFTTLSFAAGLVVWKPSKFEVLMLASCVVVFLAALIFTASSLLQLLNGQEYGIIPPNGQVDGVNEDAVH